MYVIQKGLGGKYDELCIFGSKNLYFENEFKIF